MNRDQWQSKRGHHAEILPGLPDLKGNGGDHPALMDYGAIPRPAIDPSMRRRDAESCCDWGLLTSKTSRD